MIDPETSVRLLAALVVLVYGALVVLGLEDRREWFWKHRGVSMMVGALPFLVWVLWPGVFAGTDIDAAVEFRRAALIVGAAAIALRYAAVRARRRSGESRTVLAAVSTVLLAAFVGLATMNWIVAIAGVLSATAVRPWPAAAASRREASTPPPDQRES